MPTHYSIEAKGNEVKFWTNNDELYNDVTRYIKNCVDAISWRNRVEQVKRFKDEEA